MFIRAFIAFITLPGLVAIIAPPVIAYLDPWKGHTWSPGIIVICLGMVVLLWCVRDFLVAGKGTLAPWDPPKKLVVVGLYRYVRNPMYVGVLILIFGWALYFTSVLLILYLIVFAAGFHIRIIINEEPWLKSQFGTRWEAYRHEVHRWLPRLTPWKNQF